MKEIHFLKYKKSKLKLEKLEQDALTILKKDGVVIIPNFFNDSEINEIKNELEPVYEELKNEKYNRTKSIMDKKVGIYRALGINTICKTTDKFFNHPFILNIAKAYVSSEVSSYNKMCEIRPFPGKVSMTDLYHFDDWRMRFKAFLYLADVEKENAPFVFLKGTHKKGLSWRRKKEYEYYRDGKFGRYGYYFNQEIDLLKKKYGYEELVCTAKSGSLILTDTSGLHRGSVLESGKRMLLGNYFDIRDEVTDTGYYG